MELLIFIQHQRAQLFTQRRAAGFARERHCHPARLQKAGNPGQMAAFAGTVYTFQSDEFTARHGLLVLVFFERMNFVTAALCSSSVLENCELPSPRATK